MQASVPEEKPGRACRREGLRYPVPGVLCRTSLPSGARHGRKGLLYRKAPLPLGRIRGLEGQEPVAVGRHEWTGMERNAAEHDMERNERELMAPWPLDGWRKACPGARPCGWGRFDAEPDALAGEA